jgi:uncharacterized OsmC-like protein
MPDHHIRSAVEGLTAHLAAHPEKCRTTDPPAVSVLEEGLRCRATAPDGTQIVTDMAKGIGGSGTAPSPGWYARAALATCDTTVIAMRAAVLGITLSKLEVTVDTETDRRGLLGMDDAIPPGPLSVQVRVNIAADGVDAEQLREIVRWTERHSPVGDLFQRAVPAVIDVEIG